MTSTPGPCSWVLQSPLLTRQVDAHGVGPTYVYVSNHLSTITEPDGGVTTFQYSGGQLADLLEPGGRTLTLSYDGNGNISGAALPDGSVRTYAYDTQHHLTTQQVGSQTVTYTYSSSTGAVTGIDQGGGDSVQVTAASVQGLVGSGGTALNAGQVAATVREAEVLAPPQAYYDYATGLSVLQTRSSLRALLSLTIRAIGAPTSYGG